jgi:hypothetical protein
MQEYLNYLAGMITNAARCTREIKSRIAMTKAAFDKKKTFHQHIGLKCKEETIKFLHLEHSFLWCSDLASSESRSEIPGKFSHVLEKD